MSPIITFRVLENDFSSKTVQHKVQVEYETRQRHEGNTHTHTCTQKGFYSDAFVMKTNNNYTRMQN